MYCYKIYRVFVFELKNFIFFLDRCKRVIALARKFNVMVVCDDVYNLLHYDDSSVCPRRLFAFDNEYENGFTIYLIFILSFSGYCNFVLMLILNLN